MVQFSTEDGNVRLVNGTNTTNGRLEVCIKGNWGSVCERHFDDLDAAVVCRELGFPSESELIDLCPLLQTVTSFGEQNHKLPLLADWLEKKVKVNFL